MTVSAHLLADMIVTMPAAAVFMMVGVPAGILFLAIHRDGHLRAGNAALDGLRRGKTHAGHAERVQLRERRLPVGRQLQQRRRQHIAGRAHGAVEIDRFHFLTSI